MIGQTISHYRILEKLGEGGMGVVYKAQDTQLERIVALKFLPPQIIAGQEERLRFLHEAKAAATLNHQNVCTIYDIKEESSQQFIIMEYVDGVTLRQKLTQGTLGLDTVLSYAIQIADALQEAHSKGIVHRDVKAENIMVNSRNQIKVMDFGLAKLKGSLKLTRSSSTVGTLAYMSPELIEGHDADARSDIFSFGVVLYELLTGRWPFRGEHEAAVMYSIVNDEPESIDGLRTGLPPVLVNLISRALEKDPGDRYQSAEEMVIELRRLQRKSTRIVRLSQDLIHSPVTPGVPGISSDNKSVSGDSDAATALPLHRTVIGRRLVLAGAIVIVAGCGWLLKDLLFHGNPPPMHITFKKLTDQPGEEADPDISPDGNYIVYVKRVSGKSHIFLQRIGGGTPIDLLPDSKDDNWEPAFSPDGQLIAFRSERDGGGIYLMGATGESVRRLTEFGNSPSWAPDGKQLVCASVGVISPYARPEPSTLWKISVERGTRETLDTADAVQPQWSPHGNRIAYWGLPGGSGRRSIFTIDSSGRNRETVLDDGNVNWDPVWSPDGAYLYFSSDRGGSLNLWRIPIDERTGKVQGSAEPITTPSTMSGFLRVSHDGHRLIYLSIDHRSNLFRVGLDSAREAVVGSPIPITEGSKQFINPVVSPDGEWLTFWSFESQENIYVVRTDGRDLRQLTNDRFRNRGAVWSPDQRQIAFYSDRSGKYEIWAINPDGSNLQQLSNVPDQMVHTPIWCPDGKHLMFHGDSGNVEIDLSLPLEKRTPRRVVRGGETAKSDFAPLALSHDGLKLAGIQWNGTSARGAVYSIQTGTYQPLPESIFGWVWLKDDKRLLGTKGDSLFVVNLETGKSRFTSTLPEGGLWEYSLAPDNRMLYFSKGRQESDIWEVTMN